MRQHNTVIYKCVHTGDFPDRTFSSKAELLMGFTVFTVQQITNLNTYYRFNNIYTINVSVSHFSYCLNFNISHDWNACRYNSRSKSTWNSPWDALYGTVSHLAYTWSTTEIGDTRWDHLLGRGVVVRRSSCRQIFGKGTLLLSLGHSSFKVE
jgi:hypothetical protein